jgi:hypothetical protein
MDEYFTEIEINKAEEYYNERWRIWVLKNLDALAEMLREETVVL